ncbi:MAG TPA: tRNA (adenosine(37)-N6)-dimethylallyltransferase MiaA [Gemmatimonadaceae bacterium]|nr:tRNA (adenosine(37)-N6)-dimethylallyltransferase MiaA [Gemmatimonadaceae bacterium]
MAGVRLRVITGPTGAGKSALVHALAEHVPLAIVSADSRQVYRGFDIGTAKPTARERACVPHFGIDVVDPVTRYSAAAWAQDAQAWIDDAVRAGREPAIVGGTGFYVRALTAPLFVEPSLDADGRRAIASHLRTLSLGEVKRWCAALDPTRAGLGRAQLERAIEVALLTGVPLSRWHQMAPGAPSRRARYLVVDPGPALGDRIAARLDHMLDAGWIDETRALDARIPESAPGWSATGYAVVRALARGAVGRAEARERILVATRQYAKRQRTWMRHQLQPNDVTRIDPRAPDAVSRALAWWHDTSGGMG